MNNQSEEIKSAEAVKIEFIFKHPKGEIITSGAYTVDEILETDIFEILDKYCVCDCQPIGETNVVECNCDDYYNAFEYVGNRIYTSLQALPTPPKVKQ
jgi:hypothetical protein